MKIQLTRMGLSPNSMAASLVIGFRKKVRFQKFGIVAEPISQFAPIVLSLSGHKN